MVALDERGGVKTINPNFVGGDVSVVNLLVHGKDDTRVPPCYVGASSAVWGLKL